MLDIFVDADACPVKPEIYRVAQRYGLSVTLVANTWMSVPNRGAVTLEVVSEGFDAADDRIAELVGENDVVVTSDIPLASRCVKRGARVLDPTGKILDEDNIGPVLATRDLLSDLRGAGEITGGPAPFQPRDRSRFLQKLDQVIQAIRRESAPD